MKYWIGAFLVWSSLAFADEAAQPAFDVAAKASNSHICMRAALQYDQFMKSKGLHGLRAVKLDFRVGTDGAVKDLAVGISSEDPVADALALKCVQGWRYQPATKNGQPVETSHTATVSLSTDDSADPHDDDFDAAASNPAIQSCSVKAASEAELFWTNMTSSFSTPFGQNENFECARVGNNELVCRAKPGKKLYPSIVATSFYSTGARLKLAVGVQTTGDCKALMPFTFKSKLPVH